MSNPAQVGSYIPSSQIWDVSQIYATEGLSPQVQELLVRMYQNLNMMAINVNLKTTGYYDTTDFVDGSLWFPNPLYNSTTTTFPAYRQELRKIIYINSLPPGITTVNHGIMATSALSFTDLRGTANDTVGFNYYSFCGSGAGVDISITANATQVILVNNTAITFNVVYVRLEWLTN